MDNEKESMYSPTQNFDDSKNDVGTEKPPKKTKDKGKPISTNSKTKSKEKKISKNSSKEQPKKNNMTTKNKKAKSQSSSKSKSRSSSESTSFKSGSLSRSRSDSSRSRSPSRQRKKRSKSRSKRRHNDRRDESRKSLNYRSRSRGNTRHHNRYHSPAHRSRDQRYNGFPSSERHYEMDRGEGGRGRGDDRYRGRRDRSDNRDYNKKNDGWDRGYEKYREDRGGDKRRRSRLREDNFINDKLLDEQILSENIQSMDNIKAHSKKDDNDGQFVKQNAKSLNNFETRFQQPGAFGPLSPPNRPVFLPNLREEKPNMNSPSSLIQVRQGIEFNQNTPMIIPPNQQMMRAINQPITGMPNHPIGQPNQSIMGQPNPQIIGQTSQLMMRQPNQQALIRQPNRQQVIGQPNQPVMGQPNQPIMGQPNQPIMGQPNQPIMGQPTQPLIGSNPQFRIIGPPRQQGGFVFRPVQIMERGMNWPMDMRMPMSSQTNRIPLPPGVPANPPIYHGSQMDFLNPQNNHILLPLPQNQMRLEMPNPRLGEIKSSSPPPPPPPVRLYLNPVDANSRFHPPGEFNNRFTSPGDSNNLFVQSMTAPIPFEISTYNPNVPPPLIQSFNSSLHQQPLSPQTPLQSEDQINSSPSPQSKVQQYSPNSMKSETDNHYVTYQDALFADNFKSASPSLSPASPETDDLLENESEVVTYEEMPKKKKVPTATLR